jgi:sulfate transport system ATP-binding protein
VITRIHVVGPEARVDVTRSDQSGALEVYLPKTQLGGASVGQIVYLTAGRQVTLPEGE